MLPPGQSKMPSRIRRPRQIKQGGRTQPNGAGQRVVRRSVDEERRGTKKGHLAYKCPFVFRSGSET